jgi:hypothetical protein
MCPRCGWFPSRKITEDNEKKVAEMLKTDIKNHRCLDQKDIKAPELKGE